ncbi:lipopolysaccharide biosynthesis protein [Bacillus sp. AFS017336]|uniref:lipopolysaccharide biosynthesis protein n=1 Tax=Bacillus sp. AFS017336 TaxID=2033489 RepID=UPI000BF14DD8|nr:oligosaccharide flippase family protein [Bacillus sp. AFS017336]PEL13550.1 polysaccharide biosynthesis protein [Bacillus sp. AFS017336]
MNSKNLFNKFTEFALGSGIVLLLGFISSPLNTRLFSPSEFGKFSMFLLCSNFINSFILLGVDQSFMRFFHEEEVKNRSKLLYKTLKLPLILCSIISILIIVFKTYFLKFMYNISYANNELISLFVINNFAMIFNRYALLLLRMQQKGKLFSLLNIFQKLCNILILLLLFLLYDNKFIVLIYAFVITNIMVSIIGIILEKKLWKFNNKGKRINTSMKELLNYGIPLLFTFLITWIFQSFDRLFIKHFYGYKELGIYSAAFSIIALLVSFQSTFTTFWTPVAFQRFNENKNDKHFFEKINQIITIIMFIIGLILITSKDLIILLLGSKYRAASDIIPFLLLMPIMTTISETTVIGINFYKKTIYHIYIALIVAIVSIIGNYTLVPRFGIVGSAFSTSVTYIVFFIFRTYFSGKLFRVNFHLKKLFIITLMYYGYAFYALNYKFNYLYIAILLINLTIINILYKDITFFIYRKISMQLKTMKNKYYRSI